MNRVALPQADVLCAGHDRDEILIDGVTRFWRQSRTKVWTKISAKNVKQIQDRHGRLNASGRWAGPSALSDQASLSETVGLLLPDDVLQQAKTSFDLRAAWSQEVAASLPSSLPAVLENSIQGATQSAKVTAISLRNDRKASKRSLARSTVHERLDDGSNQWRASSGGQNGMICGAHEKI
jgi:vacuolar-type H+-ATPase catalytic subunit A/Vma1